MARQGRYVLAIGLVAGLLLPGVARFMQPALPFMIVFLLFLNAFRIGAKDVFAGLADVKKTLPVVLVFQLVLPLVALMIFLMLGAADRPVALAIVLMLSAPSVTGSPNITQLLGHNPEPAFRTLVLGTAILPLTILPIFWISPDLGNMRLVLIAASKLIFAIGFAISLAFLLRRFLAKPDAGLTSAIDGLTVLTLAIVVVALMSALGPALVNTPVIALQWMAVAMAANIGLQIVVFKVLKRRWGNTAVPFAIVAGNRNFALFLIALPAATTEPLLIFLACYQVPMYLTAILMRKLYI